jgi:hypothetical protein
VGQHHENEQNSQLHGGNSARFQLHSSWTLRGHYFFFGGLWNIF